MNNISKSANILIDDFCLKSYELDMDNISFFVQDEGCVVIPIYPYLVMEYAKNNLNEVEYQYIKNTLQYVNEDQNPVLLKICM